MSTRYVWGKYNITEGYKKESSIIELEATLKGNATPWSSSSYTEDPSTGQFKQYGSGTNVNMGPSVSERPYVVDNTDGYPDDPSNVMYYSDEPGAVWRHRYRNLFCTDERNFSPKYSFTKYEYVLADMKGTLQGYVSSANSAQYPSDGASGNSYVFKRPPYPLTHYPPPKNPPIPGHTGYRPCGLLRGWIRSFR